MHWVSATVFITLCWRKLRRLCERTVFPMLLLCTLAGPVSAAAELEQLRVERQEQALLLNAVLSSRDFRARDRRTRRAPVALAAPAAAAASSWRFTTSR